MAPSYLEVGASGKPGAVQAVAAAKAELRPIMKTREVDYTPQGKQRVNYRHEDLAGIEEQVTPILTKNGLSYRYESDNGPDRPITVTCILEHVDGHSTRTPLTSGPDNSGGKNSLQAIASAVTYLQRYTLKLALGLSVSHDDDGQKGGEPEIKYVTEDQLIQLRELLDASDSDEQRFCAMGKIDRLSVMPADQFENAMGILKQRLAKRGRS